MECIVISQFPKLNQICSIPVHKQEPVWEALSFSLGSMHSIWNRRYNWYEWIGLFFLFFQELFLSTSISWPQILRHANYCCFEHWIPFSRQPSQGRKAGSTTVRPFSLCISHTAPVSMQFMQWLEQFWGEVNRICSAALQMIKANIYLFYFTLYHIQSIWGCDSFG